MINIICLHAFFKFPGYLVSQHDTKTVSLVVMIIFYLRICQSPYFFTKTLVKVEVPTTFLSESF